MGVVVWGAYRICHGFLGNALSTVVSIGVGVLVYGILVLALKAITLEEIERLPKGRKLANLLRQGFSSKYIASLMNITPKSVEINRYRLRSKLGLSRSDNLIKFIKSI